MSRLSWSAEHGHYAADAGSRGTLNSPGDCGVYGSSYCAYSAILTVTTPAVLRIQEAVVLSPAGRRKTKSVAEGTAFEFRRKLGKPEFMPV
jgi:hypothetical protein